MPATKSATDDVLIHLVKQNFYLQYNFIETRNLRAGPE